MDFSFDDKITAILMIIVGIIALAFPMVSTATIGLLLGFIFLLVAIGLFIKGGMELPISRILGICSIIVAIICLLFSYELIFNPSVVSAFISIIIYIIGAILIVFGIFALITGNFFKPFSAIGISTIIFGLLTIIIGIFIKDPRTLGALIGVWLIISGILSLFSDKEKSYIDV